MHGRTSLHSRALFVGVLCAWAVLSPIRASADDATPTVPSPSPVATTAPTAQQAESTALPTVVQEMTTPVVTVAVPTIAAESSATPTPGLRLPTATPPAPIVQPTPTPAAVGSAPWPSAQDLETDARLRWGDGIPASVKRWAFLIVPAARKYHLDPNLIAAVMTMESNGDPLALSYADARGLMQVLHGPWNPAQNVEQGAAMLAQLYSEFGDWSLALAGYNAGPGAVENAGGIPDIRETRDYVVIVLYLWDLYSHHRLTDARRALYGKTVRDLARFADQRKKVAPLAQAAKVAATLPPQEVVSICTGVSCDATQSGSIFDSLDPFWPVSDAPDPLQRVDPFASSP